MTEEEIQALKEAKEAAEAAAESAKAEAEKAKGDLTGVVDELKEERIKKQEALDKLKGINNPNPNSAPRVIQDVNQLVEEALEKREAERIRNEVSDAIESFKGSKTEFQSDASGIVFEKFKKDLSRFSFADVKSKEEAKQRLEEAYDFLRGRGAHPDEGTNYEGSNPAPNNPPSNDTSISKDAKRILEANNISEDKFKKISSKYGDALAGLGFGR